MAPCSQPCTAPRFHLPGEHRVSAGAAQGGKGMYLLSGSLQPPSFHRFSIPTLKVRFWKLKVLVTVVSSSLRSCGPSPARFLCPWDSPGENTGVGFHSLRQGIFPTQGSNLGLLHCRQVLSCLSRYNPCFWRTLTI